MVAVHFWLCFLDSITNLLRSAGFQSFGIVSVVQEKMGHTSEDKEVDGH
uniref:Transmembrane protein n=1 Tax=Medicago truncatula TaxID=3880 RepID=A2Q4J0_MEDTR|nr:hypothetical protein MtrDRAFT_AC157502g19v2 [Medicago truncatula]